MNQIVRSVGIGVRLSISLRASNAGLWSVGQAGGSSLLGRAGNPLVGLIGTGYGTLGIPDRRYVSTSYATATARTPAVAPGSKGNDKVRDTDKNSDKKAGSTGGVDLTPLRLANELYAVCRIHNRPYVVTEGDKLVLPFRMKQARVGDTLRLTDVSRIGSRNHTLVDDPVDPSLYSLKAVVLEKTKRKFQVRPVKKQRNRRVRHVQRKGDLTVLRINELTVL